MSEILEHIRKNETFLDLHYQILAALHQSGLENFLRERAQPQIIGQGNDVQAMATQAARSVGYFECLDDILNFKTKYLKTPADVNSLPLDFGASKALLENGDLSEGEINAIRNGNTAELKPIDIRKPSGAVNPLPSGKPAPIPTTKPAGSKWRSVFTRTPSSPNS